MVGLLLAAIYFFGDGTLVQFGSSPFFATSTSSGIFQEENSAVSIADQSAGETVLVESVTVPPPGVWVAVREVTGGELGNVLGAARVGGPLSQVSIPLLRATLPGRSYAIQLYRDDNDGVFDPGKNSVYIDFDSGAPVITHFSTNA